MPKLSPELAKELDDIRYLHPHAFYGDDQDIVEQAVRGFLSGMKKSAGDYFKLSIRQCDTPVEKFDRLVKQVARLTDDFERRDEEIFRLSAALRDLTATEVSDD